MHWSYVFLALTHWYIVNVSSSDNDRMYVVLNN